MTAGAPDPTGGPVDRTYCDRVGDQTDSAELVTRVNDLVHKLQQRDIELEVSRSEAKRLATELEAALDEVGELRTALKQMTRQQNTAG